MACYSLSLQTGFESITNNSISHSTVTYYKTQIVEKIRNSRIFQLFGLSLNNLCYICRRSIIFKFHEIARIFESRKLFKIYLTVTKYKNWEGK